jgi:Cell division protein CrgA
MAREVRSASPGRRREREFAGEDRPNPVWFMPIMIGFMLVGLAWIVVFYVSSGQFPIEGLASWNIAIGFGIALIGFAMTLRWR